MRDGRAELWGREQLSGMSSLLSHKSAPRCPMRHQRGENRQELPQTGHTGDFGCLADAAHPEEDTPNHRIALGGHHGGHGQGGTDRSPATPDLSLPPQRPLPRLSGATPTNAALCLRLRAPSSGRSASKVRLITGPTPGVGCSSSSCSHQSGLWRIASSRSSLRRVSSAVSQVTCAQIRRWSRVGTVLSRFFSR